VSPPNPKPTPRSSWPLPEVRRLIEPSLGSLGFTVEELTRTGKALRLVIDRTSGVVSVDDCQHVSELVGPLLDQADLIPDSYTLEVWSPGAERPLKSRADYLRFMGFLVNVRARSGEAEVVVEGTLETVDEQGITVVGQRKGGRANKEVRTEIAWPDIQAARTAVAL
jgi:ribosome maturation factor RimP